MRARDNPYRTERLHALSFRLRDISWDGLLRRLRKLQGRGCVLGPHGTGKTTILQALTDRLRRQGLAIHDHTLRIDDPMLRLDPILWNLKADRAVILDGADLLNPQEWRRVKNAGAGWLIVSSHRRKLLPKLYRCRSTPQLLEELMQELHPGNSCAQPSPDQLYHCHRGNLREALLELYDFHAALPDSSCCIDRLGGKLKARVSKLE